MGDVQFDGNKRFEWESFANYQRWEVNQNQDIESDLQIVLLKVLLLALLKVFLPKKVLKRVLFKVLLKGVSY